MKACKATILCSVAWSMSAVSASATDYLFHVSCSDKRLVVEWQTGTVDPGREYLRVATGTKFPNCVVSDYNELRDSQLPRERYSHEGGVIQGIPLLGTLLCWLFSC
jgi:hypothetical protein